jgi:hypothetical protein
MDRSGQHVSHSYFYFTCFVKLRMESIKRDDLSVFGGCCCSYSLCYFETPDCIGCAYERECLCLSQKCCCKSGAELFWCTVIKILLESEYIFSISKGVSSIKKFRVEFAIYSIIQLYDLSIYNKVKV